MGALFLLCFLTILPSARSQGCTMTGDNISVADCQSLRLQQVPGYLTPTLVRVNLDHNDIEKLTTTSFFPYPNLEEIYLSHNNISLISKGTFDKLKRLRVLDLTLNKLSFSLANFPPDLFINNPDLSGLFLAGQFGESHPDKAVEAMLDLDGLEHVSISPAGSSLHPRLARLPKLRTLDFQWGDINGELTKDMLEPFVDLPLTEISFHSCGIKNVEDGAFTDFSGLELLNVACNYHLDPSRVVHSLSESGNHSVTSLILDATGASVEVTLGPGDNGTCENFWGQLGRLSMEGVRFEFSNLGPCVPKLREIVLTYSTLRNAFEIEPISWAKMLFGLPQNIQAFRISHFLEYNKAHSRPALDCEHQHGISPRRNQDYFQTPANAEACLPVSEHKRRLGFGHMLLRGCFLYPTAAPHKCVEYIDLSHIALNRNAPFVNCLWFPPNQLRVLNASHCVNCADVMPGPLIGLTELEVLDISHWGLKSVDFGLFVDMPSLKELYLQGNKLGVDGIKPFPTSQILKMLDLSDNGLLNISQSVFHNLTALESLRLQGNELQNLSFLDETLQMLRILDVSHNQLQHITTEEVARLEDINKASDDFVLDISGNPLQCDCAVLDFTHWVQTTSIHIKAFDRLICTRKDGRQVKVSEVDVDKLKMQCNNLIKNITASVSVALVVLVMSAVSYRKRWTIKWHYYKLKRSLNKRPSTARLDGDQQNHAFVLYSFRDDYSRQWAFRTLRIKVEEDWQLHLYLLGRDDVPGEYELNNVVDGLKSSRKAIWLLTPDFVKNNVCVNGAHFAVCHLGAASNLIVSFGDNELCPEDIPSSLAGLLDPKMNIRRAKFSSLDENYRLFWANIQDFLMDKCDTQNTDVDANGQNQSLM